MSDDDSYVIQPNCDIIFILIILYTNDKIHMQDSDEAPTDGNELAGMCNFVESNGDAMLIIWTYTYSKVHVESFQGFEGGIIDMNSYDADENGDDMWDNDDHTAPIVATITGGIKLVQTTVMKPSVCTIM